VYDQMYANGYCSVDGIPAIIASIPALGVDYFISSLYQTNRIDGIAGLLNKVGYTNAFFHGGMNGTFKLDIFTKAAGFDLYFGKDEYNNDSDFDGAWGIYDGPFFNFTAKEMSKLPEPFCVGLFSLTSHHPYNIPKAFEEKVSFESNKARKAMLYSDHALRQFFRLASKQPWFNNTLFIITSDHRGAELRGDIRNSLQQFEIPLIIYKPGTDWGEHVDFTVQQVDILPGIMDYLSTDLPFCSFGTSLFRSEEFHTAFHSNIAYQTLIKDQYCLKLYNKGGAKLYNWVQDESLKNNLKSSQPEAYNRMLDYMLAVIQQFNSSMINNRLTIEHYQSE
ncbi:MAG: sulfatase-like hydrolase/transferase, partial [Bacteroidetes bacterium]|nr:sulfatase-like hydrolase/transferase [Bacteroidota bacterium]